MKNTSTLLLLYVCIIFTACSKQTLETENNNQTDNLPVNIGVLPSKTNFGNGYLPLNLFIFNKEGECISKQDIHNEEDLFSIKLDSGSYYISAFSYLDKSEYSYPESPVYDDIIEFKNSYSKSYPLMSGHLELDVKQPENILIPVTYCVSELETSFSDLPTDVTGVTISISPINNGYSFNGMYTSTTSKAEIECSFNNGSWEADPIYILTSGTDDTVISINIHKESGTETHILKAKLLPCIPYNLIGNYFDGFTINIGFDIEGWKPSVDIDFDIIPGGTTEWEDTDEDPGAEVTPDTDDTEIPTLYSDYLPKPNSIWKSFYVWTTKEISSTEIEALIITPDQWPDILAKDAQATLEWYEKDGLSNWRTFTEEETRAFHKAFPGTSEAFEDLNWLLYENGHNQFYCSNKERYLCRNLEYTFNLVDVSSSGTLIIRQAGEKTGYYLRPVKTIRIKLQ